jgi:hypothetical protein
LSSLALCVSPLLPNFLAQKYKAFTAEIANLQKVLKKKGATAASDEFPKVEAALNDWLTEIDLPVAREL